MGNKDRKYSSCGTTLLAAFAAASCNASTLPPVTQACVREYWEKTVPSALGGPFDTPLFALLSAVPDSLWMR